MRWRMSLRASSRAWYWRGSGWRCRHRWAYRRAPRWSATAPGQILVRLRPHRLRDALAAAPHARRWRLGTPELGIGQDADRRRSRFLDFRFARRLAAEPAV